MKEKTHAITGRESAPRLTSNSVDNHQQLPKDLKIDTSHIQEGKSLKKEEKLNTIGASSTTKQQIQPKTPADWREFTHLGKREIIRPVFYKKDNEGNTLGSPEHKLNSASNEHPAHIEVNSTPNRIRPPTEYQQDSLKVEEIFTIILLLIIKF